MDRIWTPWRYAYTTRQHPEGRKGVPPELSAWPGDLKCVFCNLLASVDYAIEHGMPRDDAERAAHLVARGRHCFLCLNAFPYTTGHILIVPYQHVDSLAALAEPAAMEMMAHMRTMQTVYQMVYKPHGMNFGLNLGEAAGAGVADHVHMHGLPRWIGDANFMTPIGEVRILPETLDITWERLRGPLQERIRAAE